MLTAEFCGMKHSSDKNASNLLSDCTICSVFLVLSVLAILAMVNFPPGDF